MNGDGFVSADLQQLWPEIVWALMNTPPHKCGTCRQLVVGECPHCKGKRRERADRTRFTREDRSLYRTERWKQYSRGYLALHPWCVGVPSGVHGNQRVLAQCTDHIVPAKDSVEMFWDPDNHRPLCHACNARHAMQESSR